MISNTAIRNEVRHRAEFKCEFCGISEADSGGELTIDHFHPKSKGGDETAWGEFEERFGTTKHTKDTKKEIVDKDI